MMTVKVVAGKLTDDELTAVVDALSMMRDDLNATVGDVLTALWNEEARREIAEM